METHHGLVLITQVPPIHDAMGYTVQVVALHFDQKYKTNFPGTSTIIVVMLLACDCLDDGSGFLMPEEDCMIKVLLWVKDKPTKAICYNSYDHIRSSALENTTSSIKDSSAQNTSPHV